VDLVNCQVGRGDIPYCQVGKGEEVSSDESSLADEEEDEEKPHSDGDSRRTVSRVNEDDEKLQTSVIEEKNQRNVLIIVGTEKFLPRGRGDDSIDVVDATRRYQVETITEEKE
jgi:hypothetical protein